MTLPYLDISSLEQVASGEKRDIFLIEPGQIDAIRVETPCVLKVPRYRALYDALPRFKRVLRRLFPFSAYLEITREVKYRRKLDQRVAAKAKALPLPVFFGYVDTSQGRGVLWEAGFDETGQLAPTLTEVAKTGRAEDYLDQLNTFADACFTHDVIAADLHASNLVCAIRDGESTLLLIDGFGDHRMISFRALLPGYNKRKLTGRMTKMGQRIGLPFDAKTRRFSAKN